MKKLLFLTISILLVYCNLFAQNPCPNLVSNGDFESGGGFTSGLTSSCACTAGTYCVNSNFNLKCAGWPNLSGKGGSGNFLIVDGNPSAATNVWATTVPVSPGGQYTFSFWVASVYPSSQQSFDLGMMVNGQNVNQFTVSQQTPTWTKYTHTGTCPAGVTNLPIAIRQISGGGFRDFGIDCVEFTCCVCEADFNIVNLDNCGHFEFLNTSTGPGASSYSWNFGDGTTSNQQSTSHQFTHCGTYTVCLTISGTGCSSTKCYTVTVVDNIPPVAVCQPGVGVDLGGNCTFPVTTAMVDGGSSDNCQIQSMSVSPNVLGSCGTYLITLTVTDWCGNTSTCTTGMQTGEGTPPVITCPPNSTVNTSPGVCFYAGNIPLPTATDNCSTPTVVCSLLTGTQSILITPQTEFPKGANTITCYAQDACENVSQNCTYTLTVRDNQPPVITCKPTISVVGQINPAGLCSRIIEQIAPVITDNCPMVGVNYAISGGTTGTGANNASGTIFTGTSTVVYTATDMAGNTSTCSTRIYITCDSCACDGSAPSQNLISNGSFTLGNTGFTSGLSQGNCTTGSYGVYSNFNGYCASWPNLSAHSAPSCLLIDGSTAPGATVLWQSPVTIVPNMDYCFSFCWASAITNPPQSFPITIDIVNAVGFPVPGTVPVGTQLIAQNPLTGWQTRTFTWPSGSLSGSYFIAIRQASGSIYRDFGIDDICFKKVPPAPVCTCGTFSDMTYRPLQGAPNIAVECGDTLGANCGAPINWTLGGAFACQGNSCPPNAPMYWTLTGPAGSTPQTGSMSSPFFSLSFPPSYFNVGGMYQLSLSGICGTDTCHCNFVINATCPCDADFAINNLNNCGNFEFINTSAGPGGMATNWNFGDGTTSTQSNPTHQFTHCGTYTVCLTISGNGCTSTQCYTVTVVDNTPPVAVCAPGIGVTLNANCAYNVTTAMIDAGSTDNCQIQSMSVSPAVLTGCQNHTITLTVTDWCGNTGTCTTGIQTTEATPPVITCPPNSTVSTSPGVCYYTGPTLPTATDNCTPNPTVVCSLLTATQSILINAQTQFPKGVNTITCYAQDNCGNVSPNCTYTLTVVDNQPPVITCKPTISVVGQINAAGLCSRIIEYIAPVVTDNCPMVSVNYAISGGTTGTGANNASGTIFTGTSTVVYTATDMAGNTSTCSTRIYITCDSCACDGSAPSQNLISNGSFTLGNTGFTSGLSQGTCTTGSYGVYSNFNGYCSSWPNRPAHTAPNCLLLDGSAAPGATVLWQSPVTIVPNMDYCFSFWWASAITSPTQSFPITIDIVDAAGVPVVGIPTIGTQTIAQNPLTGWQQSTFTWNSGAATGSYYIAIRQLSGSIYRDFGIDDICFKKVPPAPVCTCGTFSDMTYRPAHGAPNFAIECGDTLTASCVMTDEWTLGGTFACQGAGCPPNAQMNWTLTGPSGSTPHSGTMTGPSFGLSLSPWYFNVTGGYQLTLSGICGTDTCYCDFVINATCPPCPDCPGNIVKNPGFSEGIVPGELGAGGLSNNWMAASGTPDVSINSYGCDPGGIQMWGSQDKGEAICQTGLTFTPGKAYTISFSGMFYQDPSLIPTYVQFGFYASNGCVNPYTNCSGCETIGISTQISNSFYATYTLPNWSPPVGSGPLNTLIIKALNAYNYPDISYGRIDNICIRECDSIQLGTGLMGDFPFNGISNSSPQQVITDNTNTANGTGYDITSNPYSTAHFNGSSSWINGTTNSRGVISEVSVVAWVKTTEDTMGQWIAGQYDGTAGDKGYLLTIGSVNNNNIGRVNFSGRDGTTTYHNSGNSTTLVNDGAWHCVAGTAGGQEWRVYVDGQLENSSTLASTILLTPTVYPFTIGRTSDPSLPALWMNGDLDDVRVYNRVLTICEIDSVCTDNSVSAVVHPISNAQLLIYPNPNTGSFTLELPVPAESGTNFRITDLTGRVVWGKQADIGSKQQAIQTGNLPNGLYFVQVISEGRILGVERFVKQ